MKKIINSTRFPPLLSVTFPGSENEHYFNKEVQLYFTAMLCTCRSVQKY